MGWVKKHTPVSKKTGHFFNGREIALVKEDGQPLKRPNHKGTWYPEKKKIEVATTYAVTKNIKQTAELTKVYPFVVRTWIKEPWFTQIVNSVVKEKNEELDGKLSAAIDEIIDLVMDRIRNGDYVYNPKAGQEGQEVYVRIPLNTKSATAAFETFFNKRQLLRGEVTSRTEQITEESKLKQLQDNFEKLARSKQINPDREPIETSLAPPGDDPEEE